MKTIMCFGDSITWGQDPATRGRLPFRERWPGLLQRELGESVRVVEEALCDRTTVWDSPYSSYRSGKSMLLPLLQSHAPVDLLIIMLGTNDFQRQFHRSAKEVAIGVGALIEIAQVSCCGSAGGSPEVLAIAPPPLGQLSAFAKLYFEGQEKESGLLAGCLESVCEIQGARWLDAGAVVSASAADGVHLDATAHQALSAYLAATIR